MDRSKFSSVARHAEFGSKVLNDEVMNEVLDEAINYLEEEIRRPTVDDTN